MVVAYHTHEFQIPTATESEVAAGTETGKVVTPATLGSSTAFATAAQGALADTALQPADVGTAAAEDVGYFATAAQGALADTATQPADLATVATSGSYSDLSGLPTLGTAAAAAVGDFATAAQGAKADTALQAVPDGAVTNTKLADMATATIKGRATAGTGVPEDLTTTQVKELLSITSPVRSFATSAALLLAVVPDDSIVVADVPMKADASGTFLDSTGKKFKPAFWVTPRLFGAVGDGYADDRLSVQAAWDFAGANAVPCLMQGLKYNCSESVYTHTKAKVIAQGAIMYPTAWPVFGGFIHNGRPVVAEREQTDVYIEGLITDGSKLPHYYQAKAYPDQADNLIPAQSDFTDAAWSKSGCTVTSNTATAPDGTVTADRLTESAVTGNHYVVNTAGTAVASGDMIVHSIYVKSADRNVAISFGGTAFSAVVSVGTFNLSTNAVISKSADLKVAEVQQIGDTGWSLVTIAKEAVAAGTYDVGVFMADATGTRSYAGNGTSYIEVWSDFSNIAATGKNTNLGPEFGRGAENIRVVNCIARYCRAGVGGGTGGGGFGGESGLKNVFFINCHAHDCFRGYRVAGKTGTNVSDGTARFCVNTTFKDCTAKNCGTALFAHAVGEGGNWDQSDLSIFDVLFDGFYAEDCGHQAWVEYDFDTYTTVDEQKFGVFGFGGAQNVRMRGLRVKINSTYPDSFTDWLGRTGYPAAGLGYMAGGLSGSVGALFWGHGRNIVVEDCTIDGITEVLWKCARAQVMGDLASIPPVGANVGQNVFNIRQVRSGGYLYVFDGEDIGANLMAALSSSVIRLTPNNSPATGVVGPNGTVSQPNVKIEVLSNSGKWETGSADEWKAQGNVRPTSPQSTHHKGGLDLSGGYSSTGTKFGLTYDGATGVERSSHMVTSTAFHRAFYNPNGLVGSISSNAAGVGFTTTSHEPWKNFIGEYDWQEAFRIIKADPVREWNWTPEHGGGYGVGWGAQTSYAVSPDLATPGGWFGPDGMPCDEGTEGADFVPWGVDQGKRTPYLWAAVSHLIDEVAALKAELEALRI